MQPRLQQDSHRSPTFTKKKKMGLLNRLFGPKEDFKALIEGGATVIDVRSPAEFVSGHYPGAKNIPLGNIQEKIGSLEKLNQPLILCCASGARSGQATRLLKGKGLEVYNAGSWRNL